MTANRTPSFLIITARCLLQGFSVGILTSILLSLLVLLLSPAAGAMTADHGEAPTVEHPADVTRGSLLLKTANGLEEAGRQPVLGALEFERQAFVTSDWVLRSRHDAFQRMPKRR